MLIFTIKYDKQSVTRQFRDINNSLQCSHLLQVKLYSIIKFQL